MASTRRRPYEELRSGIEQLGGTVSWQRAGYRYGAWKFDLNGNSAIFESNGRGFPGIDELYKPLVVGKTPTHWSDYSIHLIDGAIDKLVAKLK
nr:hypothetical protein [Armatimonas sp.]